MTEKEFLCEIKSKTKHLSKAERRELLAYYGEMISERMEDGMSEAQAVEAIGSVDELLASYTGLDGNSPKPKDSRLKGWQIVLIAVGSPLWISLALAAFCVLLALYIVVWALVIVLYAVFAAFAAAFVGCICSGILCLIVSTPSYGFVLLGVGFIMGGFACLLLLLSNISAKGAVKLTVNTTKRFVKLFRRKG